MNADRIETALRGARVPLCGDCLISLDDDGEIESTDAVGALLRAAGVDDAALRRLAAHLADECDEDLISCRYGRLLQQEYGIDGPDDLVVIMNANDSANDGDRLNAVLDAIRATAS